MEIKDLYLEKSNEIETFNALNSEELEMFAMGMIYKNEDLGLEYLPYQYIHETGIYKAKKIFQNIKKCLNSDIAKYADSMISEDGQLVLCSRESFEELSKNIKCKYNKGSLKHFYEDLCELVKDKNAIEVETAQQTSTYNHNFTHENIYYNYTFKTNYCLFIEKDNGYFSDLFETNIVIDCSKEDYQKLEQWKNRMEEYEKVKDMVDHAPKKPEVTYIYHKFITPTQYCIDLINTYKNLIKEESDII